MKFLVILAFCVVSALAHCDKAPLIKAAWNQVKHNEVDILYTVFKENPEIQARFPKFTGKDLEGLKGTPEFAIHATRIVSFISEVIRLLGNPTTEPAINTLFIEMANNHKNRGVTKELFNKFKGSVMNYLKSHATWNEQTEAAIKAVSKEYTSVIYSILE